MLLYGDTKYDNYAEGFTNSFWLQYEKSGSSQWKGNGDIGIQTIDQRNSTAQDVSGIESEASVLDWSSLSSKHRGHAMPQPSH